MSALVRGFFHLTLLPLARFLYRPRVFRADQFPESGGVMLIANHTTYIDALMLYGACPRPVRFVIVSRFMNVKAIGWYLRLFGAIPIRQDRPREAIRASAEALANGDVVCIFPEGQLTRTGTLLGLQKGYQLIARKADATVVPVFMDGLWDSIFSNEGGRHFWKWPRRFPCPVRIAFGQGVPAKEASLEWARSELRALSAETFAARSELDWSLGEAAVRGLKHRPGTACFIEHGKRRRVLKRGQVLAIATVLSQRWKASLPEDEERIGVLLPPGWTPGLLNLALAFANRVPINLPFDAETFDQEILADHLDALGIRSVVTSKAFASQLAGFPWRHGEGQFIDMGGELSSANLLSVLVERVLARIEPKWLAVRRLGFYEHGPDRAAGYLPPGGRPDDLVTVSRRSVIANALQLTAGDFVHRDERLFCEAPLTSAAGLVFSLWLPVLRPATCSGRSFALRAARSMLETVLSDDDITLMVGRESLIDQLGKLEEPWHPELRERLRAIYLFPRDPFDSTLLNQRFDPVESKTGAPVCLGWAPDDLGAVISVSVPDLLPRPGQSLQKGQLEGANGRLLPGFFVEIAGESGARLTGAGLESEKTPESITIDADGFVFSGSRTLP